MISLSLLALVGVMDCVPHEYVIDFFEPPVPFKHELTLELWARDGTSLEVTVVIPADNDNPEGARGAFLWALKDNRWVAREGPGATMVVTGTKKGSPIKAVTVKSDKVVLVQAHWVPLLPEKKK
jgi:hypothetical protein